MAVHFFNEEITFNIDDQPVLTSWLEQVIQTFNHQLQELNYIFCNDDYLLDINQTYLNHDTLTDIITFDNSEEANLIEGDIFISIDRVKENAVIFNTSFKTELHRVLAHGLLHLLGYNDKTSEEQEEMRKKEEACLSLLPFYS